MNKITILRELYVQQVDGNKWLDKVPREVSTAFFDNPYVESLQRSQDLLMTCVFTEAEQDWADWFLLEWTNDKSLTVGYDNGAGNRGVFSFNTIEDFVNYLVNHEDWEAEQPATTVAEKYEAAYKQAWKTKAANWTDHEQSKWALMLDYKQGVLAMEVFTGYQHRVIFPTRVEALAFVDAVGYEAFRDFLNCEDVS